MLFYKIISNSKIANEKEPLAGGKQLFLRLMAGATRLELAVSGVTGRRYNQLNYAPKKLRQ